MTTPRSNPDRSEQEPVIRAIDEIDAQTGITPKEELTTEPTVDNIERKQRLPLPKQVLVIEDMDSMREELLETLWQMDGLPKDLRITAPASLTSLSLTLEDGPFGVAFLDLDLSEWQEKLTSLKVATNIAQVMAPGGTVVVVSSRASHPDIQKELATAFDGADVQLVPLNKVVLWSPEQTEQVTNLLRSLGQELTPPAGAPVESTGARTTESKPDTFSVSHKALNSLLLVPHFLKKAPQDPDKLDKFHELAGETTKRLTEVLQRLTHAEAVLGADTPQIGLFRRKVEQILQLVQLAEADPMSQPENSTWDEVFQQPIDDLSDLDSLLRQSKTYRPLADY